MSWSLGNPTDESLSSVIDVGFAMHDNSAKILEKPSRPGGCSTAKRIILALLIHRRTMGSMADAGYRYEGYP